MAQGRPLVADAEAAVIARLAGKRFEARREDGGLLLRLAGRVYALGVDWRGVSPNPRAAARAVARAEGAAGVARVEAGQYGLGPAGFRGAPAGAAVLADAGGAGADGTAWIGVWPLPGRAEWWGVAVSARGGQIYPGFGDAVLDGEAAARSWLAEHVEGIEWSRVFAPPGWDERAEALEVEAALGGRSGPRLGGAHPVAPAAAGIAAAAVAGVAAWVVLAPGPAPVVAPPPPALRAAVPPPTAPVAPVAARCARLLDGLYATGFPAGWEWTAAACSVSGGRVEARLEGRARPWLAVATTAPANPPGMAVSFRGRTAAMRAEAPLAGAAARAPEDAGALSAALARAAEALGGALGRGLDTVEEAAAHDPERDRRPDWRWLAWTLETRAPLALWSAALAEAGATGLVSARLDLAAGAWRVGGRTAVRGGMGG